MSLLDTLVRRGTALTTPFLPDDYLGLLNPLWAADLRARVESVTPEAAGAATLVLTPGRGWSGHTAGQYVGVGVEIDGVRHWRTYSLTSPDRVTITVKALGLVSDHLVRRTPPGTVLRLRPAAGDFVFPATPTRKALFLTAGSGITPAMGMLRALRSKGELPAITHLHSALTRDEVIFGAELRQLAATDDSYQLLERHTDTDGLLALTELDDLVPDWRERETWACGPAGLLDAVEEHWQDRHHLLHVERFSPPTTGGGEAGNISFRRTGTEARADGTLLDAGEAAGVLMPSGCRMGICFGCVVPLLEGQVRDVRTGDVHGEPGDLIQTCISTSAGDCSLDV